MIKFFKTDAKSRTVRLPNFEKGCWVDLVNPTDDEVEDIVTTTGIPEEMLKAALDEEESARMEREDGVLMCLVDTPTITDTDEGDTYETIPIALIYNDKCIVTVSLRGNPVLGDIISNRTATDTRRAPFFILNFLMGNAKRFLFNLRQIDKKSLRVQAELHRTMKNKDLLQLLSLEKSLVYINTSLNSNLGVYNRFGRLSVITGNEEYSDLFDDMLIETRQAVEMCNVYRDVLSGTMEAFASVINNNMNIVMKSLTIITIIITLPTLIASLWGMNVPVPFGDNAWGFVIVLGIAVLFTAAVSYFVIRATNTTRTKPTKQIKKKRRGE